MSAYATASRKKGMNMAGPKHAMTLVSQLVTLLDDQITSAENGQFERVENLMGEVSALAHEVVNTRAFDDPSCQAWQDDITERYRRLELILASAKANTQDELKFAKTTLKMLGVYRSSNR